MKPGLLSYILVAIQFITLGVIALTGAWFARSPILLAVQFAGVALGLWGIAAVRIRHLSILPDVRAGSPFVRRGPYRYIRHPMYAGLLLATLPAVIADPSPLRIGALIVLLIDIIVKIHHEERLLHAAYEEYAAYAQQTKRLIPALY